MAAYDYFEEFTLRHATKVPGHKNSIVYNTALPIQPSGTGQKNTRRNY